MNVLGIDPSVDHACFALWPSRRIWRFKTPHLGAERYAERLAEIARLTRELAARPDCNPGAVYIERTRGQHPKDSLLMASGVIVATLHEAFEVPILEVSTGTWKKHALGRGNAKKWEVQEWAKPLAGDLTEDEADALAIACAGYRLLETEQQPLNVAA